MSYVRERERGMTIIFNFFVKIIIAEEVHKRFGYFESVAK